MNESIEQLDQESRPKQRDPRDITELFQTRLGYPEEEKWLLSQFFSITPLKPNDKEPSWSSFNKMHRMTPEEAFSHWVKNPDDNVGIRPGKPSKTIVIDADKHNPGDRSPEVLLSNFPQLRETVHVKTPRGDHYYLQYPESLFIPSGEIELEGQKIEIFAGNGSKNYVVAPISTYGGITRMFDREGSPIIQPIPPGLLELITKPSIEQVKNTIDKKGISFKYPVKPCTQQLADYQPPKPIGERENILFMLRNLLKRDHYSQEAIRYYTAKKNSLFEIPLDNKELDKIHQEKYYGYRCKTIGKEFPWINCNECLNKGISMDLEKVDKMTTLPPEAMAIYYKHMKGKSYNQIATECNITIKAVRYNLDKINKELDKGIAKTSKDER